VNKEMQTLVFVLLWCKEEERKKLGKGISGGKADGYRYRQFS